ncbi:hypothetical protein ERO13_D07G160760v2 [Gossypium hirsutum]|uniref:Uncharacterized protein n=1 Tax=Gossypium tomentosum TaxID=34277 RepID=A0A5D2K832_GOSTO|nr:hypothetical protein ERO13_D07G160760v2 [Gossypium hirsutum]TYH63318.1 hypothetical protein ES332_D07G183500v1 [Gossypium tomentosum]
MFRNFSWVRSVDYRVLRGIDCCWLIFLERCWYTCFWNSRQKTSRCVMKTQEINDRRKSKLGLSTRSCVTHDRVTGRVCVTQSGLFGSCGPHGRV